MTPQDDIDRKYRAPALEKGLDILELLAGHSGPMTPSQISTELERSVSELFRMIQVLEFRRYIEATPDGYRLTNRLFSLGAAQEPVKSLMETALPVMRDLATRMVQSCHLIVPSDDQIVVVARIEGPGDFGYTARLGFRRDILDTTSGLLFYGCASEKGRAALRARLEHRFERERVDRYVIAAEAAGLDKFVRRESAFVTGVTNLATPIMGADGVIAVLVTPYIQRTPPTCDVDEALALLRAAAATVSTEMTTVSQA